MISTKNTQVQCFIHVTSHTTTQDSTIFPNYGDFHEIRSTVIRHFPPFGLLTRQKTTNLSKSEAANLRLRLRSNQSDRTSTRFGSLKAFCLLQLRSRNAPIFGTHTTYNHTPFNNTTAPRIDPCRTLTLNHHHHDNQTLK